MSEFYSFLKSEFHCVHTPNFLICLVTKQRTFGFFPPLEYGKQSTMNQCPCWHLFSNFMCFSVGRPLQWPQWISALANIYFLISCVFCVTAPSVITVIINCEAVGLICVSLKIHNIECLSVWFIGLSFLWKNVYLCTFLFCWGVSVLHIFFILILAVVLSPNAHI